MKIKTLIACFILACAATSCIQDEALNSEAAIDACVGNDIQQAAIDSENFTIQLYVSKAADLTKVNINFQLPVGASIAPASPQTGDNVSSSVYNFKDENPRIFKVTSEHKVCSNLHHHALANGNARLLPFRNSELRQSFPYFL